MSGITLDAGPLIAFERNERKAVVLLARASEQGTEVAVPAGVVAQVWRNPRQVRLARLLRHVDVVALDDAQARLVGTLCVRVPRPDIVDASVVVTAWKRNHKVITTDLDGLNQYRVPVQIVRLR